MDDMRDMLIDILLHKPNKLTFEQLADYLLSDKEIYRAFELLKAEKEGNLILPPCKVGDTVWEWISVKDRLPENGTKCLVYTNRGEYGGCEITYYNDGFYIQYSDVTHWQYLPQPPKEEEKALREKEK